jgi:mxaJ protein
MKRLLLLAALSLAGCSVKAAPTVLTVCADPNNLPFSNRAQQGFENKVANLVARDLGRDVHYVWWAQRRGYVRNTLGEQKCDIWPGVASGVEMVATTRPYYRSTYVFVSRADRKLTGLTLDDPRLKKLTIGVQMVGDDSMNTPPAHALAVRGIIQNVRGFMLYGDYAKPNPPAEIVRAVADGKIDVALVWGPLAGYFAKQSPVLLKLERVTPWLDNAQWPMVYDISMGVRKNDPAFKQQVEAVLARRNSQINGLLDQYGVPRTD